MHVIYERRGVSPWAGGSWYEVETGELVSSDIVEARLEERWRAQNGNRRWYSELDNQVALWRPEPRTFPIGKRKTVEGYFRLAEYKGLISWLLVLAIAMLVVLHFLRVLP